MKGASTREHLARVATAAIALPALYLIIRYLPPPGFFFFVSAGILISQHEFYRMSVPRERGGSMGVGLLFGLLLPAAFYLGAADYAGAAVLVLTLAGICVMLTSLFSVRDLRQSATDSAVLLAGILYISLMLSHLIPLRGLADGWALVLFVFAITWFADAGAYYVGTLMGRRPLAPRISPKKTVEGAVGAVVSAVAASVAAQQWFLPFMSAWDAVLVGVLLGIAGLLGDLSESLWKRGAGVKDSGRLIGAHGGLLDKLDGIIFTTPVFYYYLVLVKDYGA